MINDSIANWDLEEYDIFLETLPQEYVQAYGCDNNVNKQN